MKKVILIALIFSFQSLFAQVYNYGANEITFKDFIKNDITYVKTGNPHFDSLMISYLDAYWTLTEFKVVEQYKRPEKTSTALFVTQREFTKKHMMDRKNQHVLVLQPAEIYVPRKSIKMEQTLGYMYLNGFYDLVSEADEYRFAQILVKSLHQGLSIIKNNNLKGEPEKLNAKIATKITGTDPPSAGNTLILNREQTRHIIVKEELQKLNIKYRLLAEDEYYATLEKKDPSHIIFYYAVNRFTEMALVRVANGEMIYSKHFRESNPTFSKKELKLIAPYFR